MKTSEMRTKRKMANEANASEAKEAVLDYMDRVTCDEFEEDNGSNDTPTDYPD